MTEAERQTRAGDWIAALCAMPARFAGTTTEHAAAEKVAAWMRQLGIEEVTLQAVVSRPRTGWALALHAGIAAFGLWWEGPSGVVLTWLAAWSFQREFSGGRLLLSNLLPAPPSVNAVARTGPAGAARRVILSAHIDTAQAGWLFAPALADFFARMARRRQRPDKPPPGPLALPRALVFGAAALAFLHLLGARGSLIGLFDAVVYAGLLLAVVLNLQWASSAPTPGANDNASAVASMLTCAQELLANKPSDVELWLVGTGAEEVGCRGMHSFLDRHLDWERAGTFFLNFECTGGGALHYILSEGVLGKFRYPNALLDVAASTANGSGFADVTPTDLLAATDGHVPAHHGFPSLSLISLEANGVPRHYHRRDDKPEGVDLGLVVRAADFGEAVITKALGAAEEHRTTDEHS